MAYGLQCFNDSGELTLSSDGLLLGYLGKATFVSTTAAGTDPTDSFSGYSLYTFNYAGTIIVGIGLVASSSSNGAYVESFSNSGSTWTIRIWQGSNTTNALGFETQLTATEVYVWGLPISASGYGMALFDASGNLSADLSRRPLLFKSRITMGAGVTSVAMPSITKPVIIGSVKMYRQASGASGSRFINRISNGAWYWDVGAGALVRVFRQREYSTDDGAVLSVNNIAAVNALLVEGNGLT